MVENNSSVRELALAVRTSKLKQAFKQAGFVVPLRTCRQHVIELGARATNRLVNAALSEEGDDGTYEDLKALAEKY